MSSDEEDFVFYGTPIEREEELTTRKKKAVAEASGQLRTALPPWKQEVRDEEGRRRFHGAFTGGFSAGYYNSVGSKEGWTPQSFTSSRKNRAEVKQQSILNFLDEDEKEEREGRSLGTNMQFDTFGFTASELARKQIDKEQQNRPLAIPGPVPDELIMPASESIGVKLLLKMGWRQGRSIKSSSRDSLYDVRREARKALLALGEKGEAQHSDSNLEEEDLKDVPDTPTSDETQFTKSMPEYVLNPKKDLYGLGYDPFKHAPEFRERKRLRTGGDREKERHGPLSIKGKMAPGFGIGALEDLDAEDVDVYDHGYDFQDNYVQEIEEPSQVNKDTLRILDRRKDDVLPGFKAASRSNHQPERFDPPEIPSDFTPHHKFSAPFGSDGKNDKITPPEVSPPEDNNLKVLIEGLATLVARCGKLFEDLSREKNQSNPLFAFLSGGNGSYYYARKLWEERQKRGEQTKLLDGIKDRNSEPLNAEGRGKILGEKALERSLKDASSLAASVDVQFKLSDTFTKPASLSELPDVIKPFQDDPPKQKRFEQFLKEKYEGGLRPKDSSGSSDLSEAARARERLEFEAAAEAIAKGKSVNERNPPSQSLVDFSAAAGLQFTAGTIEKDKAQQDDGLMAKAIYPKREAFDWRPAPVLCKRFDLIDPYMGKPPPAPRPRSKMDSLIFMPDLIKPSTSIEHVSGEQKLSSIGKQDKDPIHDIESQVEVENVERPVDLYKSIFSDDSEDEDDDTTTSNQVEDAEKKTEAANTALNRLIAGDFLESLGKELGQAVPPDMPVSIDKSVSEVTRKEAINSDKENKKSRPTEENKSATRNGAEDHATLQTIANITDRVKTENRGSLGDDPKNLDIRGTRNHGSSSEEDRGRKHSKSRRSKISSSDSDSSDDDESEEYRDRHHKSRTKRNEKRSSSRDRNSSKRHSKHHKHKHRRKESSSTSRRDREDRKRRKHKYED